MSFETGNKFQGKKVLVMGLGHFGGGVGVSRFLVKQGADVTVTDTGDPETLAKSLEQLQGLPITYHLGEHHQEDFLNTDLVVVNPAIPKSSPWLQFACEHNIPQTTEMNLFFEHCPAPIIGVTGSNGKSTTTAMIAHILQSVRSKTASKTWVGGNIGQANLLQQVEKIQASDRVVLELSSFQLYDLSNIKQSPHIAVVTNIAPNHLDWHGDMAAYIHAKQNILRFQSETDHAVFNANDKTFRNWPSLTQAKVHWADSETMGNIDLNLPGKHNQENAAAAITVAKLCGIDEQASCDALQSFSGLDHRLERVGKINGVTYYNDSISTTPESTIAAINAFAEKKVLILGGTDKKIAFDQLVEVLIQPESNVDSVILLGQVREKLAQQMTQAKEKNQLKLPHLDLANDFEQAVTLAHNRAKPGMVVLLSPACASYDMFQNFQQRGNCFKALVAQN